MPVTSYISVGGRMISEVTDGVILDYVPDALGSIHSVIDQDHNVVKTMRYKPYGEVLSRSGTVADRHFQWVGSYGYRATFAPSSSHYVRARHYSATAGSWTTVDPLWPQESAYGYVNGRAISWTDLTGLAPCMGPCSKFQEDGCKYNAIRFGLVYKECFVVIDTFGLGMVGCAFGCPTPRKGPEKAKADIPRKLKKYGTCSKVNKGTEGEAHCPGGTHQTTRYSCKSGKGNKKIEVKVSVVCCPCDLPNSTVQGISCEAIVQPI